MKIKKPQFVPIFSIEQNDPTNTSFIGRLYRYELNSIGLHNRSKPVSSVIETENGLNFIVDDPIYTWNTWSNKLNGNTYRIVWLEKTIFKSDVELLNMWGQVKVDALNNFSFNGRFPRLTNYLKLGNSEFVANKHLMTDNGVFKNIDCCLHKTGSSIKLKLNPKL